MDGMKEFKEMYDGEKIDEIIGCGFSHEDIFCTHRKIIMYHFFLRE